MSDGVPARSLAALFTGERAGIVLILMTTFFFVSMDTLVKHLVQSYSVTQVVWARYFFHLLLMVLFLHRDLTRVVRSARLGLQLMRSLLMLGTTFLFFIGLSYLPLADATAITLLSPIIVTALSVPLLGGQVGWRRWASVFFGLVGALIIIRPGAGVMHWAAIFPLGTAICFAFYQIATRVLSRSDPALTTLFYTAAIGAVGASLLLPFQWRTPEPLDWCLMVLVGLFGALGHFTMIRAFSVAPVRTVSPFLYSNIVWATLFGLLVFGDFPDGWTLFGAGVIVASGLYVVHRERVRAGTG